MSRAPVYATRVDVASSTVTYIGKTYAGNSPAVAEWRIQRMTSDPSGSLVIEYANGSTAYDQVWNDRASLSYS